MTARDPSHQTLRCRILGHRFEYREGKDTDEVEVVATCVRSSCDYYKELTQDNV